MNVPIYQVDAFSSKLFGGNPAAVLPLEDWLPDRTLQSIAAETNMSESAFFVKRGEDYDIRWFTPKVEIDLCGHATLASGFVVLNELEPARDGVTFHSLRSGKLKVQRKGDLYELDFPAEALERIALDDRITAALGTAPKELYKGRDFMAVFASEEEILNLEPDMELISKLEGVGLLVTAPGRDVDFVSRFFAPQVGIAEDPVTGATHCALTPYWSRRLGKRELHAKQLSKRGGELFLEDRADRVKIAGHAALFMRGVLAL